MDNAVYSLKQVGQHQGHHFCIKRTVLRPLFEPFEPRQRAIRAKAASHSSQAVLNKHK
ncbi:hypothetical protein DPMN_055593 [Dreissena polymorpha]|uniref:Uncharacterized protein n=1 Tax=Dreissena polymorpha TaxID=45954 RepID=A0A9D4CQ89_DREPO|nr:hypothetical protein DPMN_055593 [Dreissena polymorpha]